MLPDILKKKRKVSRQEPGCHCCYLIINFNLICMYVRACVGERWRRSVWTEPPADGSTSATA